MLEVTRVSDAMMDRIKFHRALLVLLSIVSCTTGNATQPDSLDSLWEKYMLDGTFAIVSIENDKSSISTEHPSDSADPQEEEITFPTLMSHPISVLRLGEGIFRNGGWVLDGGLLRRIRENEFTIELYGKRVARRYPYIPFPPDRNPPQDRSYELFLLRRDAVGHATILRKWNFPTETVIQKNPTQPRVKIQFRYERIQKMATVTIFGLKRGSFEDSLVVGK